MTHAEAVQWHHYACVLDRDKAEKRFYVDGNLVAKAKIEESNPRYTKQFKLASQFTGEIGETRLSDVARYDDDFTPIVGHEPDEHTLVLYKFDEGSGNVLKDSSGNNHHGKIMGATWIQAGGYLASLKRYALEFDVGNDIVEVPSLTLDARRPFTLEAAFIRDPKHESGVIVGHPHKTGEAVVSLGTSGRDHSTFRCGLQTIDGGRFPTMPQRIHFALVHTGEELLAFRDGKLLDRIKTSKPQATLPSEPFVIGGKIIGRFDLVRLSSTARYAADYQPRDDFASDADTIALYRFDEGKGDVLKDSSGNGHHGRIVGAKWVQVDQP